MLLHGYEKRVSDKARTLPLCSLLSTWLSTWYICALRSSYTKVWAYNCVCYLIYLIKPVDKTCALGVPKNRPNASHETVLLVYFLFHFCITTCTYNTIKFTYRSFLNTKTGFRRKSIDVSFEYQQHMFSCLLIAALWSPNLLALMYLQVFSCFCHFLIWCPGSGVVLDCINSWSLPSNLFWLENKTNILLICGPVNKWQKRTAHILYSGWN